MKKRKLSDREIEQQLEYLAALPDDQIDTSDIPELTDEQLAEMKPRMLPRGYLYHLSQKRTSTAPKRKRSR